LIVYTHGKLGMNLESDRYGSRDGSESQSSIIISEFANLVAGPFVSPSSLREPHEE